MKIIMQEEILKVMKIGALIATAFCLIISCSPSKSKASAKASAAVSKLTKEQETAFDALNTIQMNSEVGHIYSTFPGIHHNCLPTDSSFVISQGILQNALEEIFAKYHKEVSVSEQAKLTAQAVLAQKEYVVLQCTVEKSALDYDPFNHIGEKRKWILPKILGRRDIILEW